VVDVAVDPRNIVSDGVPIPHGDEFDARYAMPHSNLYTHTHDNGVGMRTIVQINLAKAAANAPHTLHALGSI